MFLFQRDRYFPLPDYDLQNNRVKLTITGKVLNIDYARMLALNKSLTLKDIILLDKVQKKQPLTEAAEKYLNVNKLIEGRKPNYFISLMVAQTIGKKAEYSRNRAFDKKYYFDLVIKAINQYSFLERKDVDQLLWNKLPDWMDENQKKNKNKQPTL